MMHSSPWSEIEIKGNPAPSTFLMEPQSVFSAIFYIFKRVSTAEYVWFTRSVVFWSCQEKHNLTH